MTRLVFYFYLISYYLVQSSSTTINIENDFRYISFEDLLPSSNRFTDTNVTSFSQLLFDISGDQVIVGARDTLYRMSLGLEVKEKSVWEAAKRVRETCQEKGQKEDDCRNYIKVLHNYHNKLYVCGTCAFSPCCSWRKLENLTVTEYDKGVAKCPFNPLANITSLMTDDGQMFVGTTTDFSGSDPAILRADIINEGRMLRTNQYNSRWLNDPQFVGSFERGEFVYFIFRETAVEHINCGKVVYSRIARVCKSDPGGTHILKDNWTSYLKARLNCSLPGEYPFYFDEVQGVSYSQEEGVLYATFTTPENSIHGSAICSFNMTAIDNAFKGPFKSQVGSSWERQDTVNRAHYECQSGRSTNGLLESSRYQLMDSAVQPSTLEPLYYAKLEEFQHIALDLISTKLHEKNRIIYVSTRSGLIKKISVLPRTKETCVIEIWKPEISPLYKIKTIQYIKETESLYVGTDNSLIKVSSQHCNRHGSISSCLNAMDPYCGWNELTLTCTPPPNGDTLTRHWLQNATQCPNLNAPVDGGWSAWSDWSQCAQHSPPNQDDNGSNIDKCLCRTRTCNNPSPKNNGNGCSGMNIEVTNCTVNGGWTDFGPWSACSQTCGMAVKTRRRTCGNPKPAHGGRVCVGNDRSEMYCSHLPPCPAPKQPPIDGNWGPWGVWSDCSALCGGGFKIRRRKCDDPVPSNGGQDCIGCHIEYEPCNNHPCSEVKRVGPWTPWMVASNGTMNDGSHIERRFRYSCKAIVTDSSSIKIALAKEESRTCQPDGSCQRTGGDGLEESGWGDWGPWGACSEPCAGGNQFRTRICERGECEGAAKMARACNTHPCKGEWSCWTDWSPCSVSCGVGLRKRTRHCLSDKFGNAPCEGSDTEDETCEMPTCDSFLGWEDWSEWSDCNEDNERVRSRKCLKLNPGPRDCQGREKEIRECIQRLAKGEIASQYSKNNGNIWLPVILVILALCACGASVLGTYLVMKRKTTTGINNIPKSPCFDTYPNEYISLPTKDYPDPGRKIKRQPSLNSGSGGSKMTVINGHNTLIKSNNMTGNTTPKVLAQKSFGECDTATIKRNSSLNNAKRNKSIEELKF